MKKIEKIKKQDVDENGNNDNFWVLVDKVNEIVERMNSRVIFSLKEQKEYELKTFLRTVLKSDSCKEPYISNVIERFISILKK